MKNNIELTEPIKNWIRFTILVYSMPFVGFKPIKNKKTA